MAIKIGDKSMTQLELVRQEINKQYEKSYGVPYYNGINLIYFTKDELIKLFGILYDKEIVVETE